MKKILINITNGFSLRYICHTDILKELVKKNKIYILSKNSNSSKKNIGIEGIEYVQYDDLKIEKYKISSKLYNFLETARMFCHGGNYKTPKIIFEYSYKKKNLKYFFYKLIIFLMNKFKILRDLLLFVQSYYYPRDLLSLIEKINPDLVLTTSIGTFSYDEYVLRIAKKLKIKALTSILSWDNTTTRGYPGSKPDHVFAWTEEMKKELIKFSDIKSNKITVSGVPHFDIYFDNTIDDVEITKKKFNISSSDKVILIVTKAPSTYQFNPNISRIICDAIKSNKIQKCKVITRIHPLFYKITEDNNLEYNSGLKVFESLEKNYNFLHINYPNITSYNQDFEMDRSEQSTLKGILKVSDVVVNIYSTINIEASIFDKPLINIDFDNMTKMYTWEKKPERQDISIDRNLDHNSRVMKLGGIKNVKNEEELINAINFYLQTPSADYKNRKKILDLEAGNNKGHAGKFIANKIFNFL